MIRRFSSVLALLALWGCGPNQPNLASAPVAAPAPAPVFVAAPEPKSDPAEGGIGGTGIVIAEGEGGIGGTGAPQLAGAVGTVTGFGSIHLNGLRVVFPPSGMVASSSGRVAEADIDLGETLEILGTLQPDGIVVPTEAMFRFPLVGQVERVDLTGTTLSIMGARVVIERGAVVVDSAENPVRISAGDYVQVSGLARGDLTIASRVERMSFPVRSSVMGRVKAGTRPGTVRINGVTVDYGGSVPPQVGWTVRASGAHENGRLVPYETVRSLLETVAVPVPNVSIEGYLEPRAGATGVGIAGFGREFDAASKLDALAGDRALFIGTVDSASFKARHGLRLPVDASARRALLEGIENGYAPAGAIEIR